MPSPTTSSCPNDRLRRIATLAMLSILPCVTHGAEPKPTVTRDCAECPELVALAAGSFRMGLPAEEADRDQDEGLRPGCAHRRLCHGPV